MSLWVDKHRPTSLGKLDYHKEQASWLKKLVRFYIDFDLTKGLGKIIWPELEQHNWSGLTE